MARRRKSGAEKRAFFRVGLWGKGDLACQLQEQFHFFPATDDQRRPLVQAGWRNVQDICFAINRSSACLFGQERDRVRFVEQAQLAVWMALCGRIQEHAALEERSVEVRYQGADVA